MSYVSADRFVAKPGDALNANYYVVDRLGEGSYGAVYKVENPLDKGLMMAAKVLKLYEILPELRPNVSKRFEREFECGRIDSPYLVKSIDYGEVKGNPFLIMEYCPNGNASNMMGKHLPVTQLNRFANEVLLGLKILHQNGIIHRDLKPENILLDFQNKAKLTDFGIAGYQNSRMTKVNMYGKAKDIFGTYAYIAPEQANPSLAFKSLGPTADMFSFGVALFEILTGKLPFGRLEQDADLGEYMKRANRGQFDDIGQYRKDLPANWKQLINGCLEANYKTRIQSTDDALKLLLGNNYQPDSNLLPAFDFHRNIIGLQVMHGEEPGRIYNLSRDIPGESGALTIGWYDENRPNSNNITILETQTKWISRFHATIEKNKDFKAWIIRDGQWHYVEGKWVWKNSTNGTLVNSTEATMGGVILKPGDIITIGDTTLKVIIKNK